MTNVSAVKEPPLYLMFLLICIGTIGAVLYTPALPYITQHFNITDDLAELTMTFYLVGYALGQLFYGPLSNRLGRKPTLYIGLSIASLGAAMSCFSAYTSIVWLLIISRLIFSLGASAGIQVIFTVIGDYYKPPRSTQITSYLTLAFALGPSIGITIGGYLTEYLGWVSCFYFLFLYCIVLMFLVSLFPETKIKKDMQALKLKNVFEEYLSKFRSTKIVVGAILVGAAVAFSYIFATAAPFVAIHSIGLSPGNYGLLNLIPSAGLVIGALGSAALAKRTSPIRIILLACIITTVGALSMFVCFIFGFLNIFTLFLPFTVSLIGQPMIEANVVCLCLEHHANKATTSAIVNFINLSLCVIFVLLISLPATVVPISLPLLFLFLSGLIFYLFKKVKQHFQPGSE